MDLLTEIFGRGRNLDTLQMCCRGIAVFLYALALIRLSGRRSFGIRTPMDNIIVILLGAVLSRGVVGVSPLIPVLATCLVIVLLHRLFGWLSIINETFSRLIEGNKILLFTDGHFIKKNIQRALVCEEDIMQGVRKSALTDNLDQISRIYMERNGEISAIKN